MNPLANKNILLGVSGGIAAYKAVEILRLMTDQGARVRVIATANALNFVGATTFEALSKRPVSSHLFGPNTNADLRNIRVNHRGGTQVRVSKVNLARYFETGDDTTLPPVRPGDTIYIPAKDREWLDESPESTIRVLGAVKDPGRYRFADNMTLLDLLAEAGGPTSSAYVDRITVVNLSCCKDQARVFDLEEFSREPDFSKLPVVRAGDTVYVPDKSDSVWYQVREGIIDLFRIVSIVAIIAAL